MSKSVEFFIYAVALLDISSTKQYDRERLIDIINFQAARMVDLARFMKREGIQADRIKQSSQFVHQLRALPETHWMKVCIRENLRPDLVKVFTEKRDDQALRKQPQSSSKDRKPL